MKIRKAEKIAGYYWLDERQAARLDKMIEERRVEWHTEERHLCYPSGFCTSKTVKYPIIYYKGQAYYAAPAWGTYMLCPLK